MRSEPGLVARLLPVLVLVGLGCAGGPAPSDHFYRLDVPTPEGRATPLLSGALEVDRPRVEAVAQSRRILYRDARRPEEIARHRYHEWADPPASMIQDQLVTYLRAAGVAEPVVTPAVRVEATHGVSGRIGRFERMIGGGESRVVVEIELVLSRRRDDAVLLIGTYREERSAASERVADSIPAFEAATAGVFARFVADVAALDPGRRGP